MKKMKRFLLSVCILAMLIGCMGMSAFADNDDYVTYKMTAGDTVIAVCNKYGINFGQNQTWITNVNHITNYNDIKVGKVLYLPKFNTVADPTKANQVAASIGGATTAATTGTTAATATTVAATTTATTTAALTAGVTAAGLQAGDVVVSFLINHVLAPGETVGGVCAKLGVDFDSNAAKIKALSGIDNYYHIPAGKVIVIPSLTAPAGSSFTAIVAHKVQGGETVGALCNRYGLDYGKVQAQLKALNNTDNLDRITLGQTFYLPVSGAVVTGNGTTAATTGGTAAGGTVTPAQVKTYKIGKQSSAHGSFTVQLDGNEVEAAQNGKVLKIVASPEAGYKVNTVVVLKSGGDEAVAVNSMSFKMPESDVTVSVTFNAAS